MRFRLHLAIAMTAAVVPLAAGRSGPGADHAEHRRDGAGRRPVHDARLARANAPGWPRRCPGRGPFTVFAPTDKAFAKVPKKTLNALLKDKAKLRAVLLYHVAAGKLTANKVVKRSSIKTVNGARVDVRVRGSNVFLDKARVTTPNIAASNGVIHVINRVLIP